MNEPTAKERADLAFVNLAHLPNGWIALRTGLTEQQVEQKRKWMRKTNKLVGNKTLDEWINFNFITGENEYLPLTYGTAIDPEDYLGEEGDIIMGIIDTAGGKKNPDRENNRRELAQSRTDIATNRWLNNNDPEGEHLPNTWQPKMNSTCFTIGDQTGDRFFTHAFIKEGLI